MRVIVLKILLVCFVVVTAFGACCNNGSLCVTDSVNIIGQHSGNTAYSAFVAKSDCCSQKKQSGKSEKSSQHKASKPCKCHSYLAYNQFIFDKIICPVFDEPHVYKDVGKDGITFRVERPPKTSKTS